MQHYSKYIIIHLITTEKKLNLRKQSFKMPYFSWAYQTLTPSTMINFVFRPLLSILGISLLILYLYVSALSFHQTGSRRSAVKQNGTKHYQKWSKHVYQNLWIFHFFSTIAANIYNQKPITSVFILSAKIIYLPCFSQFNAKNILVNKSVLFSGQKRITLEDCDRL